MERVSVTEINDLVSKFSNTSLPKTEWTHKAHLIVALWHNENYIFDTALNLVRTKIKVYNNSVGTLNTNNSGYHETLTIFWMIVTKNFLLKNNHMNIEDSCHLFLQSELASKNTPFQYYTKETLFSENARKIWINGDIKTITLIKNKTNMECHFNLYDTEFEKQFETCKLDPTIFSHEAHLRLTWIHIKRYGLEQAEKNIQEQLKNFVEFVGEINKYNKTLTIVAVRAVDHFIHRSNSSNFRDFIVEFPQLKTDFKTLINSHYSINIFNSREAKTEFLKPDLLPFD